MHCLQLPYLSFSVELEAGARLSPQNVHSLPEKGLCQREQENDSRVIGFALSAGSGGLNFSVCLPRRSDALGSLSLAPGAPGASCSVPAPVLSPGVESPRPQTASGFVF